MSRSSAKNLDSIIESLVDVNRVTKVVEGGRNFSFSAIVVVGDQNGKVGFGIGKAKEVTEARAKATKDARRKMLAVPLYKGRTIHHDVIGRSGAAKVLLRRAAPGTGVIAGGPMRAVFNCLGVEDIVAKSLGSSNANSMIRATLDALLKLNSPKKIAARRDKAINELSTNGASNKEMFEIKE
jgi:small subunit ribosomal protein S5